MNADIFAEWLKRQGHTIKRSQSSYWYNQGPKVFQAFPYHWVIEPSKRELTDLLKQEKAIGLRYSAPFDSPIGSISYHAVFEEPSYDFENLGKWARKNVRRGLSNCSVEPISFEALANEGWRLQIDTLDRQGRKLNLEKETWKQRCQAAVDLPGFEAWGAKVNGSLAASVITFKMDDCCYMLYQQCHRDYLADHVNNALSFVITQTMVNRPDIHSILYGLHSLDAPASVDEFKFRMGYTAKPVRQRVVFHPWLAPAFNSATYALIKSFLKIQPGNTIFAKTEGMVRFYLQGKRPINHQSWPEVLQSYKAEVLANA